MQVDPLPPESVPEPLSDLDAVRQVEALIELLERRATGIGELAERSATAAGRAATAAGDAEAAQRALKEASRLAATTREAAEGVAAATTRFEARHKTAIQALGTAERHVGEAAQFAEDQAQRARNAEASLQALLKEADEKGDALDTVRALAFEAHTLATSAGGALDTRVATVEKQLAYRVDQALTRVAEMEGRRQLAGWVRGGAALVLGLLLLGGGGALWTLSTQNRELAADVARLETVALGVSDEVAAVRESAAQASSQAESLAALVDGDLRERRRRDLFAATPTAVIDATADPTRADAAGTTLRGWGLDVVFERAYRFRNPTPRPPQPPGTASPANGGGSRSAASANQPSRIYYRGDGERAAAELATVLTLPLSGDAATAAPLDWAAIGIPDAVQVAVVVGADRDSLWRRPSNP